MLVNFKQCVIFHILYSLDSAYDKSVYIFNGIAQ